MNGLWAALGIVFVAVALVVLAYGMAIGLDIRDVF